MLQTYSGHFLFLHILQIFSLQEYLKVDMYKMTIIIICFLAMIWLLKCSSLVFTM